MHSTFNTKSAVLIAPQAVATNATAGTYFDFAGYSEATVDVVLGVAGSTNAPTACKIQHSEDATNYSNITGYVSGTDYTLAAQLTTSTLNTQIAYRFCLRQDGRLARYVRVQFTPQTASQLAACTANLSRASEAPITTTDAQVGVLVMPS